MLDNRQIAPLAASEKHLDLSTELQIIFGLLCAADRLAASQEPEDAIALKDVLLAAKERAATVVARRS